MSERASSNAAVDTPFDMERAVRDWRERLFATGRVTRSDVEELESHLRDHLDALEEVGITGEDAFSTASKRLGEVTELGREFAKINTQLAWQGPVFWMAAGCLATFLGTPTMAMILRVAMLVSVRFEIPPPVVTVAAWAIMLPAPFLFFGGLFVWARRFERVTFAALEKAWVRVLSLCLAATSALVAHGAMYPLSAALFRANQKYWEHPSFLAAYRAVDRADYWMMVGVPIGLALAALWFRYRAQRDEARGAAPSGWGFVLLGAFAAVVGQVVSYFTMTASVLGGAKMGMGPSALIALTWAVTIFLPSLIFGAAHAWLHKTAPSPDRVLQSRVFVVAVAVAGAVGLMCDRWGGIPREHLFVTIDDHEFVQVIITWVQARMVAAAIAPVTIGAVVLRARHAAARFART
jgi:hypothetical protein